VWSGRKGKGYRPGIITDNYKGLPYTGLRMFCYIKDKLEPTRNGFNLTPKQFETLQ